MCGATPTGTGAAFTPVTSYTAKDGGFGPALATRNTGDDSLGTNSDGSAAKVAIFRPAAAKYGQGGVTHPVIVWGNGSTNTVDIWQGFLSRVATYGFVVVAPEQTQVAADHMNKAIDYVLKLANDPAWSQTIANGPLPSGFSITTGSRSPSAMPPRSSAPLWKVCYK
jgi:hypothetical protein